MKFRRPPLRLQPTTLWDYPSQDYGDAQQGKAGFKGATPSYIIWNLLQRYTKPKDLVVDPCAGSGTTLDVARDLDRRALGYDLHPARKDIFRVDARKLPQELTNKVDFVFIDPPYSTHILAFEGDSEVVWHEGNFQSYEEDRHKRLGTEADRPHRIKYRKLTKE